MKAIQFRNTNSNPHSSPNHPGEINHFFSLLRRLFSKLPALSYGAGNDGEDVLGLYSYKTLWRRSGTFSVVALGALILFTIFPLYIIYSTVEAATTSQSEPTITITASNATANLDLLVQSSSGTVASNGTPASFSVYTNNYTGYTLSIKSNSSNTALTNTTNSSYSLSSISSSTTNANNIANGSWGYLPSKYNSSANTTTYYPSPTTTATTLDNVSSAGTNNYTIGIAAKADYTKLAGTYSNTYTLTAVVNGFNYRITYNKGNTTDTVTNLPSVQSANAVSSSSIKLRADVPVRSGYTFNGWCSVMPTTANGSDSCSGDRYWTMNIVSGPTYYFNKKINNTNITLYAMWEEVKIYMQDLTFDLCPATVTKVYDKRDEKDYQIVKINDICWMVQNLRFVGNGIGTATSLSASTSNVSADKSITFADLTSGNSYDEARIHDSGDTTTGVHYNFAAASAMYITGSSNTTNSDYDICPKNWHLPTGPYSTSGTDGYSVFQNTAYDSWVSEANASAPLKTYFKVTGGNYGSGTLNSASTYGGWWSATAYNATTRYYLRYNTSNGFNSNNGARYFGLYVRCVMTPPLLKDGMYMQDVTTDMIENTEELAGFTLKDKRDEKDYTVKKINGQLWMTQNLRLTGGSSSLALDSTLSNVSSYTMPAESTSNFTSSSYSTDGHTCSTDTSKGCWYNYYSASAGTISGNSNTTVATSDICPKNWHLPTGPSTTSNTDFNKLVGNTTSGWQNPTTGLSAFGAVAGGYYYYGSLYYTGLGYWWSATAYNATCRYALLYDSSDGQFRGNYDDLRYYGFFVRCVHD